MTRFEPRTSGFGSKCSTNWYKTTAQTIAIFCFAIFDLLFLSFNSKSVADQTWTRTCWGPATTAALTTARPRCPGSISTTSNVKKQPKKFSVSTITTIISNSNEPCRCLHLWRLFHPASWLPFSPLTYFSTHLPLRLLLTSFSLLSSTILSWGARLPEHCHIRSHRRRPWRFWRIFSGFFNFGKLNSTVASAWGRTWSRKMRKWWVRFNSVKHCKMWLQMEWIC